MNEEEIFSGRISEEMSIAIRSKRESLHLSLNRLGKILGVSWLTVRNWENQKVKKCHLRVVQRLRRFLNGEYDALAESKAELKKVLTNSGGYLPPVLNKLARTMRLCSSSPETVNNLVIAVRAALSYAIVAMSQEE